MLAVGSRAFQDEIPDVPILTGREAPNEHNLISCTGLCCFSGLILPECRNGIITPSIGLDMAIEDQSRLKCIKARQNRHSQPESKKSYVRKYFPGAFRNFLKYLASPT